MALPPAIKRIYDPPAPQDGQRVLTERLWPRGVSKARANVADWPKELAPSPELRRWYGHEPERWPEFQRRYRAELATQRPALQALLARCQAGPVTLVYAARDEQRNSTRVLREVLLELAGAEQ